MQKYNLSFNRSDASERVLKSGMGWIIVALAAGFGGVTAKTASAAEAKENWVHYCSRCHGPDGTGNTKMGRKLRLKDLSSEKMQTKLSDEEIIDMIIDGNQEENGKNGMPSFKDKLAPDERKALASFIRTFKK